MSRRTLTVLFVLVLGVMLLAACGGAATATPEPTVAPTDVPAETPTEVPTEVPADTPTPEPTAEPVALTVWADLTRATALNAVKDQVLADWNIDLQVQEVDFGQIRDQIKLAAPAGEGPDLFIGAHDWVGELAQNGILASIDVGDKASEFSAPALAMFQYNGEQDGLPYATENIALFYNPNLVPTPPTTWEEVIAISKELQSSGAATYGWIKQSGDPFHFYPLQTAFGGYVFGQNEDGSWDTSNVGIDNEGSLAAAAFYDQAIKDGVIVKDVDWDTMHVLFETCDAAMIITGPWALTRLNDAKAANECFDYAVADLPGATQDATPFLGGQGFFVNKFSENQLLAQTFLTEVVSTPEFMQALFDADPRGPAFNGVDTSAQPALAAIAAAGANAVAMPNIPEMNSVWGPWGDALTQIENQQTEADAAFTNAAEQIRTALSATPTPEAAEAEATPTPEAAE